jgi:hypothetical protein
MRLNVLGEWRRPFRGRKERFQKKEPHHSPHVSKMGTFIAFKFFYTLRGKLTINLAEAQVLKA